MNAVETVVFDATPLNHFARAGELAVLQALVEPYRCVSPDLVMEELRRGARRHATIADVLNLDWLEVVRLEGLDELYAFARYMQRLGNVKRNAGEASVLAWAEVHGAAVYIDDQVAYNAGRAQGLRTYRTLQLIISAVRQKLFDEVRAQGLVTRLVDEDARFPRQAREDLIGWARAAGLL